MRIINLILDSERQNMPIDMTGILQGNMNIEFQVKLSESGVLKTIPDGTKIKVIFRFLRYDMAYNLSSSDPKYNISVSDNTIRIPANIVSVIKAGQVQLKIVLNDIYTYSAVYNVDPNADFAEPIIDPSIVEYAHSDLSNVPAIMNANQGDMFYKNAGILSKAPVRIDDINKKLISLYDLQIPPNSIYFGLNTSMHENGGYLEYQTETLGKNYLLLDYENDPETGSKRPIVGIRGIKEIKVEDQPIITTPMNGLTEINFGTPLYNRQIQRVYFNFTNDVNNFKFALEVNGKVVADYPTGSWNSNEVKGYDFTSGIQHIDLTPFWTELTSYNIKVLLSADNQINMLGNGTLPYLAFDLNRIVMKEVAYLEDVTNIDISGKFADLTDVAKPMTANKLLSTNSAGNGIIYVDTPKFDTDNIVFGKTFGIKATNRSGATIPAGSFVKIDADENDFACSLITKPFTYTDELIGICKEQTADRAEATVILVSSIMTNTTTFGLKGKDVYIGFKYTGSVSEITIGPKESMYQPFGKIGKYGYQDAYNRYFVSFNAFLLISHSVASSNTMSVDEIITEMETKVGDDRLDASAIKNLPSGSIETGETIKTKLETLIGNERLSANAIKDLPSGGDTAIDIKEKLETLTGPDKLSATAIKDIVDVINRVDGGNANAVFTDTMNGGAA